MGSVQFPEGIVEQGIDTIDVVRRRVRRKEAFSAHADSPGRGLQLHGLLPSKGVTSYELEKNVSLPQTVGPTGSSPREKRSERLRTIQPLDGALSVRCTYVRALLIEGCLSPKQLSIPQQREAVHARGLVRWSMRRSLVSFLC